MTIAGLSTTGLRARVVALLWLAVVGCASLDAAPGPSGASAPASSGGEAGVPTSDDAELAAAPSPVDERPALETSRGRVSYYADSLAGRSTASGEPYDPARLTAASRTLPFGTLVRVTREDTGATVLVRVNDRGPFGNRGRIMDLSRAAAEALDMIRAGVITVRAEVVEWGPRRR